MASTTTAVPSCLVPASSCPRMDRAPEPDVAQVGPADARRPHGRALRRCPAAPPARRRPLRPRRSVQPSSSSSSGRDRTGCCRQENHRYPRGRVSAGRSDACPGRPRPSADEEFACEEPVRVLALSAADAADHGRDGGRARAAEAAGFPGIAGMDHLAPPLAESQPMFEAMITSTWLAGRTERFGSVRSCCATRSGIRRSWPAGGLPRPRLRRTVRARDRLGSVAGEMGDIRRRFHPRRRRV